MSFHRIAYEALDVCNALSMDSIERAVARAGLAPGDRALDIGTGNAAVAIRMAERFGLSVVAVEADPAMASLAADRIAASNAAVNLRLARSGEVLAAEPPFGLIIAIGTTDAAGDGSRAPEALFNGLYRHLAPGGWLLWGDLFWIGDPPEPLRQLVEATNTYATDEGWRSAAERAGYSVVRADISGEAEWDRYTRTMDTAAQAWLATNPGAPEAEAVRLNADRVKAMFDFGRPWLGFGLYLLRQS